MSRRAKAILRGLGWGFINFGILHVAGLICTFPLILAVGCHNPYMLFWYLLHIILALIISVAIELEKEDKKRY